MLLVFLTTYILSENICYNFCCVYFIVFAQNIFSVFLYTYIHMQIKKYLIYILHRNKLYFNIFRISKIFPVQSWFASRQYYFKLFINLIHDIFFRISLGVATPFDQFASDDYDDVDAALWIRGQGRLCPGAFKAASRPGDSTPYSNYLLSFSRFPLAKCV